MYFWKAVTEIKIFKDYSMSKTSKLIKMFQPEDRMFKSNDFIFNSLKLGYLKECPDKNLGIRECKEGRVNLGFNYCRK